MHKPTQIAIAIKSAMTRDGVTQIALANRTGVPQGNISRFLAGKSGLSSDTLGLLAKGLGREWVLRKPKADPARGE